MKITFTATHPDAEISPGKINLTADYSENAMVEFDLVMKLDAERPSSPEPEEVWMELTFHYQRQSDRTWKRNPIIGERGSGGVRDVHDMNWDRYEDYEKYVSLVDALFEPPQGMNQVLEKVRSDALNTKVAALENQITNLKRIM